MSPKTPITRTTSNGRKLYLCGDGVYRALGRTMWDYRDRAKDGREISAENRNLSQAWSR